MQIGITILVFGSALLPAIIWLIFFLKEDIHPEPKRAILYAFIAGGLVSLPVLASQVMFQNIITAISNNQMYLILGLALIEEVFKFLAAFFVVDREPYFDEPIDAMVYMIVAALGFATVENLFIVGNNLSAISSSSALEILSTVSLRFVGATLLHALSSGIIGFHWGLKRMGKSAVLVISSGIILATLVHFIFNFLVLKFQDNNLLYSSLFLVAVAFFVFNDFERLRRD